MSTTKTNNNTAAPPLTGQKRVQPDVAAPAPTTDPKKAKTANVAAHPTPANVASTEATLATGTTTASLVLPGVPATPAKPTTLHNTPTGKPTTGAPLKRPVQVPIEVGMEKQNNWQNAIGDSVLKDLTVKKLDNVSSGKQAYV